MQKRVSKIIFSLLIVSIMTMLSGFCFSQLLFDLTIKVNMAQAAPEDHFSHDFDACAPDITPSAGPMVEPLTSCPNQPLACCVENSHNEIISIFQVIEPLKLISLISSIPERPLTAVQSSQLVYQAPLILPPEILSLQTTILRL